MLRIQQEALIRPLRLTQPPALIQRLLLTLHNRLLIQHLLQRHLLILQRHLILVLPLLLIHLLTRHNTHLVVLCTLLYLVVIILALRTHLQVRVPTRHRLLILTQADILHPVLHPIILHIQVVLHLILLNSIRVDMDIILLHTKK